MTDVVDQQKRATFTDYLRALFKGILDPIGTFLNRIGLTPNTLTVLGLIGNTIGAVFLMRGEMVIGGLLILIMGPVDALDGTMARLRGEPTKFGAFVDSVTDRYSELVIYLGLLLFFLQEGNWIVSSLVYFAAAGSVLVSYVRARAEALNYEAKVGIMTRVERYIVLAPSLVLSVPHVGVAIVAILANVTAIQRIIHVRHQAHLQMENNKK